jgi:putative transposase
MIVLRTVTISESKLQVNLPDTTHDKKCGSLLSGSCFLNRVSVLGDSFMQQERERTRRDVYIHLVWSTYRRSRVIDANVEKRLHPMLVALSKQKRCPVLAVGGLEDHVHVLVKLASTVTMADLVQQMKGASSKCLSDNADGEGFRWQDGYSATSIHSEIVPRVKNYINTQRRRHEAGEIWKDLEPQHEDPSSSGRSPSSADSRRLQPMD